MAILRIEDAKEDPFYLKERELEVKEILSTLEVGKTAVIEIKCEIGNYKTSFYYFLGKYNEACAEGVKDWTDKKFKFNKTDNSEVWRITRLK